MSLSAFSRVLDVLMYYSPSGAASAAALRCAAVCTSAASTTASLSAGMLVMLGSAVIRATSHVVDFINGNAASVVYCVLCPLLR